VRGTSYPSPCERISVHDAGTLGHMGRHAGNDLVEERVVRLTASRRGPRATSGQDLEPLTRLILPASWVDTSLHE